MDLCSEAKEMLNIIHYVYLGIIIVVPIILIFVGMLDMAKAVTEKDDKKIKEAQQSLIKKAIAAVLVFLIPYLVSLVMKLASSAEYKECWNIIRGGIKTVGD